MSSIYKDPYVNSVLNFIQFNSEFWNRENRYQDVSNAYISRS